MSHSSRISDYTLNSKSRNIEYQFASGECVPGSYSCSCGDFLAEHPDKSPEDFAAWKAFSDEDYHQQKLHDYNTTRLDWNIEWSEQAGLCAVKSPEDILIAQVEAEEFRRKRKRQIVLAKKALAALTDVQRRRYILHIGHELTTREIAEAEGVKHQSVVESISSAKKKIQKIIAKG